MYQKSMWMEVVLTFHSEKMNNLHLPKHIEIVARNQQKNSPNENLAKARKYSCRCQYTDSVSPELAIYRNRVHLGSQKGPSWRIIGSEGNVWRPSPSRPLLLGVPNCLSFIWMEAIKYVTCKCSIHSGCGHRCLLRGLFSFKVVCKPYVGIN